MSTNNRRRHRRQRARGISVRVVAGTADAFLMLGNISMGGVFVRSTRIFPVGTRVTIELTSPGTRHPLKLAGEVANVVTHRDSVATGSASGMGIRFADLSQPDLRRLEELLGNLTATVTEDDGRRPLGRPAGAGGSDPFSGDPEVKRAESREQRPSPSPPPIQSGASGPKPAQTAQNPRLSGLSPPQAHVTPPRVIALAPPPRESPPAIAPEANPTIGLLERALWAAHEEIARLKKENAALRDELRRQR